LTTIHDIGPEVAKSIVRFFSEPTNHVILDKLRNADVIPQYRVTEATAVTSGVFSGKTVIFTGTLVKMPRSAAKQLVESLGGTVSESLTKKTHLLITGASPGSKLDKARSLGVAIMDENEFLQWIQA